MEEVAMPEDENFIQARNTAGGACAALAAIVITLYAILKLEILEISPKPPPTVNGTVTGRAYCTVSGAEKPIVGASVHVTGPYGTVTQVTNTAGYFMASVKRNRDYMTVDDHYSLTLTHPDYTPTAKFIDIPIGSVASALVVFNMGLCKEQPPVHVEGVVTGFAYCEDAQAPASAVRKPLAGAIVSIAGPYDTAMVTTDAAGSFTAKLKRTGDYMRISDTYHIGVTHPDVVPATKTIYITAGKLVSDRIEFNMGPCKERTVNAVIGGFAYCKDLEQGPAVKKPVAGATVVITSIYGAVTVTTDAVGKFIANVKRSGSYASTGDSYTLALSHPKYGSMTNLLDMPPGSLSGTVNFDLGLCEGGTLPGTFIVKVSSHDSPLRPLPGATVTVLDSSGAKMPSVLTSTAGIASVTVPAAKLPGSFTILVQPPGRAYTPAEIRSAPIAMKQGETVTVEVEFKSGTVT
jgi:hypothetical protein